MRVYVHYILLLYLLTYHLWDEIVAVVAILSCSVFRSAAFLQCVVLLLLGTYIYLVYNLPVGFHYMQMQGPMVRGTAVVSPLHVCMYVRMCPFLLVADLVT